MSKNNNVNPGQYKVAGRERQGENVNQREEKAALKQTQKAFRKRTNSQAKRQS